MELQRWDSTVVGAFAGGVVSKASCTDPPAVLTNGGLYADDCVDILGLPQQAHSSRRLRPHILHPRSWGTVYCSLQALYRAPRSCDLHHRDVLHYSRTDHCRLSTLSMAPSRGLSRSYYVARYQHDPHVCVAQGQAILGPRPPSCQVRPFCPYRFVPLHILLLWLDS